MNKKELYESIIQNVAKQVKRALNEDIEMDDEVWGVEDFDNEADENGEIGVTIRRFCCGGRESIESYWNLSVVNAHDDYWDVKAVCTSSEDRRYVEGDEVEFELDKDASIWDLESILQSRLDEEGY